MILVERCYRLTGFQESVEIVVTEAELRQLIAGAQREEARRAA